MAIRNKNSIPQRKLPINDLPHDAFPDLPDSMKQRFPESQQWIKTVQDRFDILQKRLWEKEIESEMWKKTVEDRLDL